MCSPVVRRTAARDGSAASRSTTADNPAWGDCPVKGECSADLNADGTVGILDLLTLLANWGACP